MPRSKNYRSEQVAMSAAQAPVDNPDPVIVLPPNPKSQRELDLRPWLGQGFDAWVWAFATVLRSLIGSGNFSIATVVSLHANGIKNFMPFLIDGPLHFPPKKPADLTSFDLKRFISRMKLRYPTGSTAKNNYSALKTLLTGMNEYGLIRTDLVQLFPANPFSKAEIVLSGERPLTHSEMQRLASALKTDLIAIHQGEFDGPDSEAMGVLMLIVAMRTGINATPLMEMSRDCLKLHPFMPNMMLLHSVKRRGKGAQAQSVRQTALHDIKTTIRMDGVAVLRKALELSENLVHMAPDELKDRIWLHRCGQRGRTHIVACLATSTAAAAFRNFVKRHGILSDDGTPLRVTLAGLRKTMETRLWKLTDGDLPTVASIMGHSARVADNHYLALDEDTKAEGAKFIGAVFTEALRGSNLTPTPSGSCQDSLRGARAPKDGKHHCDQFTHCLGCPSYAIVGAHSDLYRLFSFQVFLSHEIDYYPSDEWIEWRAHHRRLIDMIDQFTLDNFERDLVESAKASANAKPHPFWAAKIRQLTATHGTMP